MTKHWHYLFLAVLVVVGLTVLFWPAAVQDDALPEQPAADSQINQSDPVIPANELPSTVLQDDLGPTGAVLNQQAIDAWHNGNIEEAMMLFEQAIDAAPDDPTPHANYGRLLTLMASFDVALPLLERARDLQPDDAQAWLDLATLYERAQLLDKSWAAHAEAERLIGANAITRDEQGRFVVQGTSVW